MRLLCLLVVLSALQWTSNAISNNLTDLVTWDQYSLTVNGNRVFIYSGEFHYQRLPVPELWPDILQKFRASGFNTISVYFFWSYHSSARGVFDFETAGKNVQRLFDYAKEAGVWIIARAGPYCNAETNGGGLALWGSDGSMGKLRSSDARYHDSWLPFVTKIGEIIAANEIGNGGPVILNQIENELQETDHSANNTLVLYMQQLEKAFRDAGVKVPFTHNEKGQHEMSWSTDYQNVGGAVDIYGLDSYPSGLSCTNPSKGMNPSPNKGFKVVRNYYQWFSNYSYTQPSYFPEFEGGWFTPWGGVFYDDCRSELDPAFVDVYYKNNIGQRTTLFSVYMAWGGTNWGHSAAPVVYTSYDYSAPMRETRELRDKMSQTKLIGLFTRVSKDLLKTEMIGNGTGYAVDSNAIWTWEIRNPDTNAGFYIVQQNDTKSIASVDFSANLKTSAGVVNVPNINLNGRQSKILVTDYDFGDHSLLYSSADILTYGVFDLDVLVLYSEEGQTSSFALKNPTSHSVFGPNRVSSTSAKDVTSFTYIQGSGISVLKTNEVLIYLLDRPTAWKFWAPPTTTNPDVKPNEQIFVIGPYLVRSASVSSAAVHISGDNDHATTIEVYTGCPDIQTIYWNGVLLTASKTAYGSIKAKIPGTEDRTVSLPSLTEWDSADSLPEKLASYDDSKWKVCDKNTTLSPVKPRTLPVLFASDYGFYTGAKIYRGYFDGGNATAVNITCSGGLAFGWNAWLNGVLLGGHVGNASLTTTSVSLSLASKLLKPVDNLITVVVDYHGHDEASTAKALENPRGILGAKLIPSNAGSNSSSNTGFKLWKINGNAGGSSNIDPVRGPMNEGGLFGERLGWPLPSFVPQAPQFSKSTPFKGLNSSGIQFYITTFNLDIDADLDVPLGIELSAPAGTIARVMIWVNGYQYGKYVSHIGPQTKFPVPPGVINNKGVNTLALSLWAMTDAGARLDKVELFKYGVYQTNFEFTRDWSYLQPGWDESRLLYA